MTTHGWHDYWSWGLINKRNHDSVSFLFQTQPQVLCPAYIRHLVKPHSILKVWFTQKLQFCQYLLNLMKLQTSSSLAHKQRFFFKVVGYHVFTCNFNEWSFRDHRRTINVSQVYYKSYLTVFYGILLHLL